MIANMVWPSAPTMGTDHMMTPSLALRALGKKNRRVALRALGKKNRRVALRALGKKNRRGAMAIELLFALPLLLAILLATIEFSILLSARQQVTSAAREAARVAALGGDENDVRLSVDRFLGPQVATIQATLTDGVGNPLPTGEPIQVVVKVPMFRMVPELLGFIGFSLRGQELTARAVMRKE